MNSHNDNSHRLTLTAKEALKAKFPVGSLVVHIRRVDPSTDEPQIARVTGYDTYEFDLVGDVIVDKGPVLISVEFNYTYEGQLYTEGDLWDESEVVATQGGLVV